MRTIRIGAGAGFSGDRIDPAVELLQKGNLDYICFECLAERTIALAQASRVSDLDAGYDPHLEARILAVLPLVHSKKVRLISNMGAANPLAAAQKIAEIAKSLGLGDLRIAAVMGDNVLDKVMQYDLPVIETGEPVSSLGQTIISANAYMGCEGIVAALKAGSDIVVTGRVGDPALYLGPMIYEFGWRLDDWPLLGRGTIVGHLLECAGQLTGGYFADPGLKDVPNLAALGFPFADVAEDGTAVFSKVEGSGGQLSVQTCKEQLLYEVLDPSAYVQPDVIADIRSVRFEEIAPNQIRFTGGSGTERPATLKVSIGHSDGYFGEGQISYAGQRCVERAELAAAIVGQRLSSRGFTYDTLQHSLIGLNSTIKTRQTSNPTEVRLRIVGHCSALLAAEAVGAEIEALFTNGPGGGGGATRAVRKVLAVVSCLLQREATAARVEVLSS